MRCYLIPVLLFAASAGAQERLSLPPIARSAPVAARLPRQTVDTSIGGAMRSLAARSGIVFVGQVVAVERKGGVAEITFRVQQAVQGAVGATYTLREWGGLWSAGQQRYALGQRAMFFLHAPNAAGLSSPVDGMEGVVPLVPMGADAAPLLDVRRLATRVQRAVGEPMNGDAVGLSDAIASIHAGLDAGRVEVQEPPQIRLPSGWKPMPVQVRGAQLRVVGAEPDAQ